MTKERALVLRKVMDKGLEALSNKELLLLKYLFPKWEKGKEYDAGSYIQFNYKLYKIIESCIPEDLTITSPFYMEVVNDGI